MRIALIDLGGLFWSTFYAAADRAPAEDAAQLAESHTLRRIRDWQTEYDHIGVAFDWKPYRRNEIDPAYKANRKPKPPVAVKALNGIITRLRSDGVPMMGEVGEEANDMIASAVRAILQHDGGSLRVEVTIISVDKDMLQLLYASDYSSVQMASYDGSSTWTEDEFRSAYGFSPQLMHDYLALAGDSADGIKGAAGIGPKKASSLLIGSDSRAPYTVQEIIAAAEEGVALEGVPEKVWEAVSTAVRYGQLQRAWQLTQLNDQASIDVEELLGIMPEREPGDDSEEEIPEPEPTLPSQPEPRAPVETEPPPAPVSTEPASEPPQRALVAASAPAPPLEQVEWTKELEPRNAADAKRLAKAVFDSQMFSAYGTPQAAFLVMMAGREFGLGAMASLRSFHIVEGRPCLSAQAMMGLCLRHPSCLSFRVVTATSEAVVVQALRKGWDGPSTWRYTRADAEQAGLTGRQNWRKYPRAMLTNRCITEAARFWFPDVVGGLYDPEELA